MPFWLVKLSWSSLASKLEVMETVALARSVLSLTATVNEVVLESYCVPPQG